MLGRIKETDLSVPVREGAYYYADRAGQQCTDLLPQEGGLDAPEEAYLDVNALAKGEAFMAIGTMSVSDDGNLLAYTTDTTGFREYKLYVRDLRTGELLEQPAEKVTSVDWAADNKTLFYTTTDAAKRPYRLYRHALGVDGSGTQLYEEKDERFSVGVGRSRSKAYLFLEIGSLTTSEVHYLAADQPAGTWKIVAPRQDNHEYDVDHRGDQFFIRTKGRPQPRVGWPPAAIRRRAQWKTIVPHRAGRDAAVGAGLRGQTVLFERPTACRGSARRSRRRSVDAWTALPLPEPAYTVSPAGNPEFRTPTFRYAYQSFTTPQSVYDYDFASGRSTLLKETEVLGGYDRTKYTTERVMATAADFVIVPRSAPLS
jgi:oligopeptidase B